MSTIRSHACTSNTRWQSRLNAAEGAAALYLPYLCCRLPAALNHAPFRALLLTHMVLVTCRCWNATVGYAATADYKQSLQTLVPLLHPEHAGGQQAAVSALRPVAGRSDDHCRVSAQ